MPAADLALGALAVLLGAMAQSATGFGMSAVAAPALFAIMVPAEAVTALAALGVLVSLLTLFTERRARHVLWTELRPALGAGVVGVVLGALLLRSLPKGMLQVLVGVAVIASAVVQARRPSPSGAPTPRLPARGRGGGYSVGLLSGGLTTSTNLNGPPLVAWLLALGAGPHELRDTVTAGLLLLNLAALPALAALGLLGGGAAFGRALVVLLLMAGLGQRLGKWVFERTDTARYERMLLAGLVAAGLASIVAGVV